MGLFNLKPDSLVGIDISSTAVKLLELSRVGNKGFRVESYGMEPLPEKAIGDDKTIADEEVVADAIRRVVSKAKPSAKFASIAVAGPSVITKVITMEKGLDDNDMMTTISMDAESYINMPTEDVYLDFEIIGTNEKEEDRDDILLAASRRETVDARIASIELGGLKVKVVDIERHALENAFKLVAEYDPEINEDETVALIEVGATVTTINVLGEKRIVYAREEMFGGNRLTEEIQSRYGLSYEEANLAKRNGSLPEDYETEVLDPFKLEMAQQISRMVQLYYAASAYGKLSHILIAGGCAAIPNIIEHINNKVGGHVTLVNPFSTMSVAARVGKKALMNDAPALMIACGLALRSFDGQH
jgi:type IV pilus assembly protein PilM